MSTIKAKEEERGWVELTEFRRKEEAWNQEVDPNRKAPPHLLEGSFTVIAQGMYSIYLYVSMHVSVCVCTCAYAGMQVYTHA